MIQKSTANIALYADVIGNVHWAPFGTIAILTEAARDGVKIVPIIFRPKSHDLANSKAMSTRKRLLRCFPLRPCNFGSTRMARLRCDSSGVCDPLGEANPDIRCRIAFNPATQSRTTPGLDCGEVPILVVCWMRNRSVWSRCGLKWAGVLLPPRVPSAHFLARCPYATGHEYIFEQFKTWSSVLGYNFTHKNSMHSRIISRVKPSSFRVPRQLYAPITTTPTSSPFRRNETVVPPRIQTEAKDRVLQQLPLSDIVRTLSVLSVAALPAPLLSAIIGFVRRHSSIIVSSRILSWPIRKTFYKAFCVGESKSEIAANIATLRSRGINGVVLSFAREAKLDGSETKSAAGAEDKALKSWVASNIETISQVSSSDYIAVKFTGAGAASVKAMQDFKHTDSTHTDGLNALKHGMFEVCEFAKQRGVKVMVDAESSLHQPAIDYLTLEAMAAYNTQGSALVFNTYQM